METSQQQRRPALGQFANTLADADLEFDAIDIADMLWLAQFMEAATTSQADDQGRSSTSISTTKTSSSAVNADNTTLNLYADDSSSSANNSQSSTQQAAEPSTDLKGTPFSVPAAPALRTRLDLARSLRPLMRKVPSRTRFELDEDATVTRIAETEVWMPVVQPQPERWLDLDLVVEDSKTTVIWERTIAELNHLAEYQGAFRTIRTWRLGSSAGTIQLFPRWRDRNLASNPRSQSAIAQRPHTPRELIDPTGRRLIWLVTDCTSLLWRQGLIYSALEDWAAVQPMAIVQMFPDRLWSRTALRDGHIVRLSALAPGLPSARLDVEGLPKRLERRSGIDLVTVPIVTLEAEAMRRWARVVSGSGDSRTPGRIFDLAFIHKQTQKSQKILERSPQFNTQRTAQERVDFFRATASSKTVKQLANLMAATPVSLPVIDLLRDAFRADFDEEVRQAHVAEVLLSGLLRRCDQEDEAICRYEFFGDDSSDRSERVRDILLGDASISKTVEVLNVLSASISQKLNSPVQSFKALLKRLQSGEAKNLREAALPFAQVGLDVLYRLGGEYADLARRYDFRNKDRDSEYQEDIAADFPLHDLEYEVAKLINFPALKTCEYESATITAVLDRFDFETATISLGIDLPMKAGDSIEWGIQRKQSSAWGYTEPLSAATDDAVGLDMIMILSGSFTMGAPESEPDTKRDERPQHEVTLQSFYLSRYPITQAQWRVVAGYERVNRDLKLDPSNCKGDHRPVEQVNWDDAVEFCKRLSAKTGKDYRLPSEAQWEYACRAGTDTPFHFGETLTTELANYDGNYTYNNGPAGEYREETTEVGIFPANDWGLHDMHGNVWEWCEDDWHGSYESAPTDGSAWVEADRTDTNRVLRGGSWDYYPWDCRSAVRDDFTRDLIDYDVGFRVCCVPPSTLLSP